MIPQLAEADGVAAALLFPAIACAVAAVVSAVGVLDPPRPPRAEAHADDLANPYRGSSTLWRIHAVSVLLVVAAGPGVDVHPGVADDRPRLVGGVGGRAGHRRPGARRGRPDRRGPVVGQDRLATAADPHHRHRRGDRDGPARGHRPAALAAVASR